MTSAWIVPRRAARRNAPTLLGPLLNLDSIFDRLPFIDRPAFETGDLTFAPAVDIDETTDALRISAELPGLEQEDFAVTIDGHLLTLKGEKKFESRSDAEGCKPDAEGCKRIERSSGSFERSFRVAWEIDPESVKAVYKNGVLELLIPKPAPEVSRIRTIPVTVL